MKFSAAAATASIALLPLGVLASPVAEQEDVQVRGQAPPDAPPASVEGQTEADLVGRDLDTRSQVRCKIVNVQNYAHCRRGPGTNYPVTHYLVRGVDYTFDCYRRGTCVNGNCTWHRLIWNGGSCYVSGYMTDSRCTVGSLGHC